MRTFTSLELIELKSHNDGSHFNIVCTLIRDRNWSICYPGRKYSCKEWLMHVYLLVFSIQGNAISGMMQQKLLSFSLCCMKKVKSRSDSPWIIIVWQIGNSNLSNHVIERRVSIKSLRFDRHNKIRSLKRWFSFGRLLAVVCIKV